jgi:hypothetical protein
LIVGWRVLYAYALSKAGRRSAAEGEFRTFKAQDFPVAEDLIWMPTMAWLAELCHDLRDPSAAALLYARLSPYSERLVVIGYVIACLGSVHRYLALLAATFGQHDAARRHFDAGIAANHRSRSKLPLAHTLRDYARFLARTGQVEAASARLEEAERLAPLRNLTSIES